MFLRKIQQKSKNKKNTRSFHTEKDKSVALAFNTMKIIKVSV
jgi:hypothetical protein